MAKGFHPQTIQRWLNWAPADGRALARVALALRISENHLRDLMDWLEEIALRDGVNIHAVLSSKTVSEIETDPRLGRPDKLKRIKDQIRRLRFPRLAASEDAVRAKIQELKLHPEIRLTVPLGLEGGCVTIEFAASSHDDIKRLTKKLTEAAERNSMGEIFDLLGSHVTSEGRALGSR